MRTRELLTAAFATLLGAARWRKAQPAFRWWASPELKPCGSTWSLFLQTRASRCSCV
jgi:hypothetical protein